MKTLRTSVIAMLSLAMLSLAACKKNGNSPSSTKPQLSFQMQADNGTANLASTSTGLKQNAVNSGITGLTWTSAVANIGRFKLEAKKNGVETEISTKNLSNVDLFALSPTLANVSINPGTYTQIEIKAQLFHTNTDAIPLKLSGTFTNGAGTVIPVEFDLNDDLEVKAEAENVTVTDSTDFTAIIHLHLNKLVAGLTAADLDNATLTNGAIVISGSSNNTIYERIKNNLSTSGDSEMRHRHHGEGGDDGGDHDGNDNSGHGEGGDH